MKKYFLILTTLVLALLISTYASNNIFMAKTPQLNPHYLTNLKTQFSKSVNSIYLALTSSSKKNENKDIASVGPTVAPKVNFDNNINPVISPTSGSQTPPASFAKIDPASIPATLFKPVTQNVSAYEIDNNNVLLKANEGASYKIIKIQLPDGRVLDGIDFSGQ